MQEAAPIKNGWFYLLLLGLLLGFNGLLFYSPQLAMVTVVGLAAAFFIFDLALFQKKLLVYLLIFSVPLSISSGTSFAFSLPAEPITGLLALFVLIRIVQGAVPRSIWSHPITVLLLADLGWMFICSVFSTMPVVSMKRFVVRAAFMLVYYLLFTQLFKEQKNIVRFYLLYLVSLAIVIIPTSIEHIPFGLTAQSSIYLAEPFFPEHTSYGAAIAFVLPMLVLLFIFPGKLGFPLRRHRLFFGILLAIILVGELLSYSRAAWISLALVVVFTFFVRWKVRLWHLLSIAVVGLALTFAYSGTVVKYIQETEAVSNQGGVGEHLRSATNIESDASNLERINRWSCAIRMFLDKPITGFGPGTYQFQYGPYQIREEMTYISTYNGDKGNAHSEYLTYLSEMGLPGILIFLVLLFTTLATGLQIIYKAPNDKVRLQALGILLGLITFMLHGIFNSFIDTDKSAILVFGSLAALTALDRFHSQPKELAE